MGGMQFRGSMSGGAPTGKPLTNYKAVRLADRQAAGDKARSREMQAQSLERRLDVLEKEGKSDEEKKSLIEQLLKIKLATELQGLAEKVAKEGTDGNLTVGKIQVKAGRVEIRVQLAALSDEVLARLKELSFKELARAKSVKLLIGTIDVKQLEALAKLPEVRRIDPSF